MSFGAPQIVESPNNLINVSLPQVECYPNESLSGEIIINAGEILLFRDVVLKLQISDGYLLELEQQQTKTDLSNKILKEQPLNLHKTLKSMGGVITLNPGKYKFQFNFQIPEGLQPSFEYPAIKANAFIRYTLIAEIISESRPARADKMIIIKAGPVITNDDMFKIDNHRIKRLGLISQGNSTLTGSYEQNNFKLGEKIGVTIEVNNTTCNCDVVKIKVNFVRKVVFFDKEKNPLYTKEKKISVQSNPVVIKKEIKRFNYLLDTIEGNVSIKGKINSFSYTDAPTKDNSILMKLFK